ncbi:MAG: response regulator [Deltaproteobacteria bacterium]|nr:response regulator [Deltaproteobacteria bacterium]
MNANILVVDDDETVRELLEMVFRREGWGVTLARNGEEAVDHLSRKSFDLMLTDLHMPRMDGYSLIPKALEFAPDMPIIVLSADSTLESIDRIFRHAIKAFLPKPFDDVGKVLKKCRQALELSRSHRDLQEKLTRAQEALSRVRDDG